MGETVKVLERSARRATSKAFREAKEHNLTVTFQQGDTIVAEQPDGTRTIVENLPEKKSFSKRLIKIK